MSSWRNRVLKNNLVNVAKLDPKQSNDEKFMRLWPDEENEKPFNKIESQNDNLFPHHSNTDNFSLTRVKHMINNLTSMSPLSISKNDIEGLTSMKSNHSRTNSNPSRTNFARSKFNQTLDPNLMKKEAKNIFQSSPKSDHHKKEMHYIERINTISSRMGDVKSELENLDSNKSNLGLAVRNALIKKFLKNQQSESRYRAELNRRALNMRTQNASKSHKIDAKKRPSFYQDINAELSKCHSINDSKYKYNTN